MSLTKQCMHVQVACGLSQLGLSATGTQQVYQRLEIKQTDLDNPQAVVHCQHIQDLVLSSNCLTTLQPLTQLKHLTSLDVSHNQLTEVSFLRACQCSCPHRPAQVVRTCAILSYAVQPHTKCVLQQTESALAAQQTRKSCNIPKLHFNLLDTCFGHHCCTGAIPSSKPKAVQQATQQQSPEGPQCISVQQQPAESRPVLQCYQHNQGLIPTQQPEGAEPCW